MVPAALVAAGLLYEHVARWRAGRSTPPGRIVMVSGRRMHLNCAGTGEPIVVLESGGGSPSSVWSEVQSGAAAFTRVCSYDRAGYQWSQSRSGARGATDIAGELKSLLTAAGETAPYVLVGHSLGGPYVSVYTLLHPADVVGLVYVDPTPVGWRPGLESERRSHIASTIGMLAREMGLQRLVLNSTRIDFPFPEPVRESLRRFGPQQARVATQEMAAISASFEQAAQLRTLGTRPVVVLSGSKLPDDLPNGELAAAQRELAEWLRAHAALAAMSTRGSHEVLAGSTHLIPFDEPNAVVEAVRQVVRTARLEQR